MTASENAREVSGVPSAAEVLGLLTDKLGPAILEQKDNLGHPEVRIDRNGVLDFFNLLKLDSELDFSMLLSVTVVDWLDEEDERFEVVYHLLSLKKQHRLRVKVRLPEEEPEIESLAGIWRSANWMEREAYDMYGIRFRQHPDLRRILMYEEFQGYPLRKDYPVQGKQPRVKMLHPEVHNTARDMHREPLVAIGGRRKEGTS